MTIFKVLYLIMAALVFLSGAIVLLRIRAVEPKLKPIYVILLFIVLTIASAIWPAALFAVLVGVVIATIETRD